MEGAQCPIPPVRVDRLRATPACVRLPDAGAPIALWLADVSRTPGDHALAWLTRHEMERAARFRRAGHVARYLAAHVALRLVIAHHAGVAPADQRYARDRDGKWHLAGGTGWQFSLGYAGDVALIGVDNGHPVGVDIEADRVIDDADGLVALHFDADERACYAGLPAPRRGAAFLGGWTRKEACLKAIGVGLHLPPAAVPTGLDGNRTVVVGGRTIDVGSLRLDGLSAAWARIR